MVNFFIVYELGTWDRDLDTKFTLEDCLFGTVKLIKIDNPDKYDCIGYAIGFHAFSNSSVNWEFGDNNISGVGNKFSVHDDYRKRISKFLVTDQQMH